CALPISSPRPAPSPGAREKIPPGQKARLLRDPRKRRGEPAADDFRRGSPPSGDQPVLPRRRASLGGGIRHGRIAGHRLQSGPPHQTGNGGAADPRHGGEADRRRGTPCERPLSTGKHVAPQPVESALTASRFIEQAVLVGHNRPFVCALVVPEFDALARHAKKRGWPFQSREELARLSRRLLKGEIERLTAEFAPFERPRKFLVLTEPFTLEKGELTRH